MADRRRGDMQARGRFLERPGAGRQLERLQREQRPRRQVVRVVRQNASAGIAIRVAAPALIWWLSDVVCGSTRAVKKRAVVSLAS